MKLTDDEIAFLLKQPDVANTLARFNKAEMYRTADNDKRMELLRRVRAFERMERS